MLSFAFTIFLSAFLLFQVQPIIARYILPWYGGSSAVWTTCMLFFQFMLLGGYAYAHALRLWLNTRRQAQVHMAMMLVSLVMLPITPDQALKPTGDQSPLLGILTLLWVTVGVPYGVVSASGPLLQHWFSQAQPGRSPYRLYALSNVGSLLGLLTYPFLVEPVLPLGDQTVFWSIGYGVYVVGAGICGWQVYRVAARTTEAVAPVAPSSAPAWSDRVRWVVLAACGSTALLAVTNQVCLDVAVVPFLWILPLSLYLISFIICFDREQWYARKVWVPAFVLSLGFSGAVLAKNNDASIYMQAIAHSLFLFCACMVCHGELVRLKPDPSRLTSFYLLISLGGALGGALASLAAPYLFSGYWELHGVMVATYLVLGGCLFRRKQQAEPSSRPSWHFFGMVAWGGGAVALVVLLGFHMASRSQNLLEVDRNFYGVLRVREYDKPNPGDPAASLETVKADRAWQRTLAHGGIQHGGQLMDPIYRHWPTTYYGRGTGVFLAIRHHPREKQGLNVGVVGLGTGTLAALGREGDVFDFYEINPAVERLSRQYFTYMEDSPAQVQVRLGDARIVMEHQMAAEKSQGFDVLVIDAFSGDAIPIHLLTLEAMKLYQYHLKEDGILAVHISNRHLDLQPVVRALAKASDRTAIWINNKEDASRAVSSSDWVLVTSNRSFLDQETVRQKTHAWADDREILWTDDFHSLVGVLR